MTATESTISKDESSLFYRKSLLPPHPQEVECLTITQNYIQEELLVDAKNYILEIGRPVDSRCE